jgi:hypothetical protein
MIGIGKLTRQIPETLQITKRLTPVAGANCGVGDYLGNLRPGELTPTQPFISTALQFLAQMGRHVLSYT